MTAEQNTTAPNIDAAALEVAKAIMAIKDEVLPGGDCQKTARIQCIVIDALERLAAWNKRAQQSKPYAWTMTGERRWQLTYDAETADAWRKNGATVIELFAAQPAQPTPVPVEQDALKDLCSRPDVVNSANILASDPPHVVVGKYRAALIATRDKEQKNG